MGIPGMISRRRAVRGIGAALLAGSARSAEADMRAAGQDVEVQIAPVSGHTVRIIALPGPVKPYTGEAVEAPLEISAYPGAGGSFLLYEDDGASLHYRSGEWTGTQMAWNDARQVLSLRLAAGSKMLPPPRRRLLVKAGTVSKEAIFEGHPLEVRFH